MGLKSNKADVDGHINISYEEGENCMDSLSVRKFLELCGKDPSAYAEELIDARMTCKPIFGAPEFTKGVLFTPGSCFEMEGAVGIGYAFDSKTLREGLDKFAEYLETI